MASQANTHDAFIKYWLVNNLDQCAQVLRLVFTTAEYALFNWKTLKLEKDTFVDSELAELRSDLILSVELRNGQTARLVFLIEHKSYQEKGNRGRAILKQLLKYQTQIYGLKSIPVIPIVIYHGRSKTWRSPFIFQDSLEGFNPTLRRYFGRYVMNFRYFFLNIHELKNSRKAKSLTCWPFLYILAHVWDIKQVVVEQFFRFGHKIPKSHQRTIMEEAARYLIRCHPKRFTWSKLGDIEKNVVKTGSLIMPQIKSFEEEVREEGRAEGIKQGIERGIQKGIEKGMEKGIKKTALEMLKNGLSLEDVKKYTNLSEQDLVKLRQTATN